MKKKINKFIFDFTLHFSILMIATYFLYPLFNKQIDWYRNIFVYTGMSLFTAYLFREKSKKIKKTKKSKK